jgi:Bacterial Ig domain
MRIISRLAILFLVLGIWSGRAMAGNCLLRPEAFQLTNDTVNWQFSLGSGLECIQGLRYASMLIDQVTVIGAPKGGQVAISGPSFRYIADPAFHGTDSFTLMIAGSKRQVPGRSSIQVDVTVP